MKSSTLILAAIAAPAALALAACSERPAAGDSAAEAPAAESATSAPATMPRSTSPEGARVFFITPVDGSTVSNPVRIEFGIEGMDVVPAGSDAPNSGHHHLIIDAGLPDLGLPIPANDNYIHFGDGSTSTERELAPGEHTLQLLLGDHLHVPHEPPVMSPVITITVE
ncbi:MAG: DUF4399 domain-containing protein [Woeseiaceae bacterium]|nr:DUF4399 domain-containing protein [Woeseiaceae bacterium]